METLEAVVQVVVAYWHHRSMRIVVPVTTLLLPILWQTKLGTESPSLGGVLTALGISLLCSAFWWWTNRTPRTSANHVGIIVALSGEDPKHDQQVQADFVRNLRDLLSQDASATAFEVIVLPPFLAARCVDSETSNRALKAARGALMLYGTVRKRTIKGEAGHMLELHGGVRHAPIPEEIGKRLGADFRAALPPVIHFKYDNDALLFQATSAWSEVAARYAIGLAAYVSGDPVYAEKLLLSAESRVAQIPKRMTGCKDFTQLVNARIAELYEQWLNALHVEYFRARQLGPVQVADIVAAKLLARVPGHYAALTWRAIAAIVLRDDVAAARQFTHQCRFQSNATWRFNRAFLHAYEGNLTAAHEEYKRAFAGKYPSNVPIQSEEFIGLILQRDPTKGQLHFALGLLNLDAKGDRIAAGIAFRAFLAHPASALFPKEVVVANAALSKLATDTEPPPRGSTP